MKKSIIIVFVYAGKNLILKKFELFSKMTLLLILVYCFTTSYLTKYNPDSTIVN